MPALTSWTAVAERKATTRILLLNWILAVGVLTGCGGGTIAPPVPPPSNPVPSISWITPTFTSVGSADTPVKITGSGFISSSTLQWNGAPIATTYGSATSLSATLPAPSCPPSGNTYIASLAAHTATTPLVSAKCGLTGLSVDASADGNFIALGSPPCIYSIQNSTYSLEPFPYAAATDPVLPCPQMQT
jgi:hypothetical protein